MPDSVADASARAAGSDPVPPRRLNTPRGVLSLAKRTAIEFWNDRVLGLAAEAAFWQLLSLPPLLLALLGAVGYVGDALGPDSVARVEASILEATGRVLAPNAVATLVQPAVHDVLEGGRFDVISIGFLLSLWSGSTAMNTYVNTITIAYNLRNCRSALKSRLVALALYFGFIGVGIVVLPALVLGPGLIVALTPADVRSEVTTAVHLAYWPVVVLGSLGLLATLYHLAVPVRIRWSRALPGAVLALLIWVAGSVALRAYVGFVVSTSSAYKSLSAPIAVLLFFYVTALAILIGAELNAELDKLAPTESTARARGRLRPAAPPGAAGR